MCRANACEYVAPCIIRRRRSAHTSAESAGGEVKMVLGAYMRLGFVAAVTYADAGGGGEGGGGGARMMHDSPMCDVRTKKKKRRDYWGVGNRRPAGEDLRLD